MKFLRKLRELPYSAAAMATVSLFAATQAHAEANTAGDVADTVTGQLTNFGNLIVGGSLVGGVALIGHGLLRLKQASDTQGQQYKYGDGIWRIAVGAGLVALPALTNIGTNTFGFGDSSVNGGSTGVSF